MQYAKAIAAALIAGLGSIVTALVNNAPGEPVLTWAEIILAVIAAVGGGGGTAWVKNAGFLNLGKLGVTEEQVKRALAGPKATGRYPAIGTD